MPPELHIPEHEWEIAERLLTNQKDGIKLPYSMKAVNGEFIPRPNYLHLASKVQITHSFIKINGQIYGIAQGKGEQSKIPHGRMSQVKYATNKQGEIILLKISQKPANTEAVKMLDLGLSYGANKRLDKQKYYITTKYLGINLKDYLSKEEHFSKLTEQRRLDIAIKLCWELHRLHYGLASKLGVQYAHLDLKPDNIIIGENDQVSIIDYGLSEEKPQDLGIRKSQAHQYMPKTSDQQLTKEQIDIVSLKRVLYTPDQYHCSYGWINRIYTLKEYLIPKYLLEHYDFFSLISTHSNADDLPNYQQEHIPALELAAIMIARIKQLDLSEEKIRSDKMLAYTIVTLYINGEAHKLKQTLANPIKIKLIGLLASKNKLHELDSLLADIKFCTAILNAESVDALNALYQLRQYNLSNYYQKASSSPEHAIATLACIQAYGIPELQVSALNKIFSTTKDCYAKALALLSQHQLSLHFQETLNNEELAKSLGNIQDEDSHLAISALLQDKLFYLPNIIKVAQNPAIAKMILDLHQNIFFIDSERNTSPFNTLLKNDFALQAFKMCLEYSISPKLEATIVRSQQLSYAIHFIGELRIANASNIEAIKNDSKLAVAINIIEPKNLTLAIAKLREQLIEIDLTNNISKQLLIQCITQWTNNISKASNGFFQSSKGIKNDPEMLEVKSFKA